MRKIKFLGLIMMMGGMAVAATGAAGATGLNGMIDARAKAGANAKADMRATADDKTAATHLTVSQIFHSPDYKVKTPAGLRYRLQSSGYDVWEDVGLVRVKQGAKGAASGTSAAGQASASGEAAQVRDTLVRWNEVAAKLAAASGSTTGAASTASANANDHAQTCTSKDVFDFVWHPNRKALLLLADRESIYRWSYRCTAYLLTWKTSEDAAKGLTPQVYPIEGQIQEPTFSPQENQLAYIRDNNLYLLDFGGAATSDANAAAGANAANTAAGNATPREKALTTDGAVNRILNGHTDWVYEEEFGFTKAYAFSPDGRYIAYLRSDESEVKEFDFTKWGALYPPSYQYKYPKAGEDNSAVALKVYDLSTQREQTLCKTAPRSEGRVSEAVAYIPRLRWTPKTNTLLFYTLNRHQNLLNIWRWNADKADAWTGSEAAGSHIKSPDLIRAAGTNPLVTSIYTERNDCYIDITDDFYCFSDESRWLISSEKDGYKHLYLYDFNGKLIKQVTQGKYETDQLYGVDEKRGKVYFSAHYAAPYQTEMMVSGLDGRGLRLLAPDLQGGGGVCRALFSDDYTRAILIHSSATSAPRYHEYALEARGEKLIQVIEDNAAMQARLQADGQVQRRFGKMAVGGYRTDFSDTIRKAGDGSAATETLLKRLSSEAAAFDTLYYWVMSPKREEGRRYPVLMFLYGGPGSQQVVNRYGGMDFWWYTHLVQQGYVVVCVDNRGTGGRGEAFKKCTYLQMGRYETQDQMAAVRYMAAQWDFVDPARVAIWGWSYGGFMSSSCLFRGEGLWKAAMAVAPVTSWRYYDNVYTERFMRTPNENPGGYDANSPIYWADKQQGAYFLAHGSGDDNVHFQNSMMLVQALQKHLKLFDFQVYPNRDHSLNGGSSREHLYESMTRFLRDNL